MKRRRPSMLLAAMAACIVFAQLAGCSLPSLNPPPPAAAGHPAQCIAKDGSCAEPGAKCCAGLVCTGIGQSAFCTHSY